MHAVMLDQVPTLTGRLAIQTVPVMFFNSRRVDGPMDEWMLVSRAQTVSSSFEGP